MTKRATRKCRACGEPMKSRTGDWMVDGLDNVTVRGVTYHRCKNNHEDMTVVGLGPLMKEIAETIARKEGDLSIRERRFLRNAIGLTVTELAEVLDLSRETVSRWESETSRQKIGKSTERLLRILVFTGPATLKRVRVDHVTARRRGSTWVVDAA